jgi:hypothetical protein
MYPYKEGLEVLENPSSDDIQKISDILNNTTTEDYLKILQIYDIAKKNTILMNMYESIAYNCMDTIKNYINTWPITDTNGALVDKNAITRENVEKIQNVISNMPKIPYSEKVFETRTYICNEPNKCDDKLSKIYNNYEKLWIDLITKYVNKMKSPDNKNAQIAKDFGAI